MSPRRRSTDTQHLTGHGLVLSAGRRRGALRQATLLGLLLFVGSGAAWWFGANRPLSQAPLEALRQENDELRRTLEQARLAAGLSASRSRELERQIDALNGQLRELQTQLMFFRKAQEGTH